MIKDKEYKASISIFLALISISLISLIMLMLESARVSGLRWKAQNTGIASLDNLFSEYNKKLWDKYKICSLEYIDDEELRETLNKYAKEYNKFISNYPITDSEFDIVNKAFITDEGGAYLEKEIIDLMKIHIVKPIDKDFISESILEDLKSANAISDIANEFNEISEIALELEVYIKKVAKNINSISSAYINIKSAISNQDNNLENEIENILLNVDELNKSFNQYNKKSLSVNKRITDIYESKKNSWSKIKIEDKKQQEFYIKAYENYKTDDEKRRKEIESFVIEVNNNKKYISIASEKIKQIKEYKEREQVKVLDESGKVIKDEQDYSKEIEELYEEIEEIFRGMDLSKTIIVNEIDENKKKDLYVLRDLLSKGLLSLVLPSNNELSRFSLNMPIKLPSSDKKVRNREKANFIDKTLIFKYIDNYFSDFLLNKGNKVSYEKEYLIAGENTDNKNLEKVISELILLRGGLNYIHILRSESLMREVKVLSLAVSGVLVMPSLSMIIEIFIIGLLALAESVLDIRLLLSGKSVPFIKKEFDFKLRPESLFNFGEILNDLEKNEKEGFYKYSIYLWVLLFFTRQEDINYRILDLMQINLSNDERYVDMKKQIYFLESKYFLKSKMIFSNFPFIKREKIFDSNINLEIEVSKSY